MRSIVIAVLLAFTLSPVARAAERSFESSAWADVEIDANGRVVAAEIPGKTGASDALTAFLLEHVKRWEFVPARHNGAPVAARTSLQISLELTPRGSEYDVKILDATPGPRLVSAVPPNYPQSAIRRGTQGMVVVGFTVKADGTVTAIVPPTDGDRALVKAAAEAVAKWTFKPELVDGVAAETKAKAPIYFSLHGQAPPRQAKSAPAPAPEQKLVAEAAVQLKPGVL